MECILPFGLLLTVVAFLVAIASRAQARADRWNRAFQALAQRYGGACLPAGWFGRPSVRFQYGHTHVLVNTYSAGAGGQFTQLHINWPDPNLRLEVSPKWAVVQRRSMRGLLEVGLGSEPFDSNYVVRTNDPAEMGNLLGEGVRWQIDRLRHFLGNDSIYVAIHRGRLLIRKYSLIRRFQDLDEFVQLGLGLFDQAMLTRTVGIDFVRESTVQLIDEAVCQICGDDIVTDMVFCRRCKTPHHLECWQYYGACSMYGCQESRYVVPRVAGPPSDVPSS